MTITRRALLFGSLALPLSQAVAATVRAAPLDGVVSGEVSAVFTRDGFALGGYDTVAYFTEGRAREGSPDYRMKWRGAVWQFASDANRQVFEMNPRAYAPQFGGYCAYTVANGYPMKSEPDVWTIHAGRLYLNFNSSIQLLWRRDMAQYIDRARGAWRRIDKN
jgi:YHS domain-containing protein